MLKSELSELIRNGENSGVEFKRDDCRPEQIAKEIVAMVNLRGGKILIGVEDDGRISGIQRPNLEEWVMDTVFGHKIHPLILPYYEEIEIEPGKKVAIISCTQGVAKPYVVRHAGREEIYIRIGSISRLATREQQAQLFATGGMLHTEALPVSGTGLNCLDLERLKDYHENIVGDSQLPASESEWEKRLCNLGFMVEQPNWRPVCTIAGLLLFSHTPRHYLRQAGLRVMAFSGTDKAYHALMDDVLDGPLIGLWKKDQDGLRRLISPGLIETFSKIMTPFLSEESAAINSELRRERRWHYPLEAIRETVMNALIHRDWTRFIDIEITAYTDRLEVISPGALQNSMTIEKMIAGQRSPRNLLLVEVMRDYNYVDARGMGVRTKVIPLMQRANGTNPIFEATEDYLKTTLRRETPR